MLMSVALLVCHDKTDDCPCWTTSGLAESVAVGAGGAGGGTAGCATWAVFLVLQATRKHSAVITRIRVQDLKLRLTILFLPKRQVRLLTFLK
jgi:hypothetical protein